VVFVLLGLTMLPQSNHARAACAYNNGPAQILGQDAAAKAQCIIERSCKPIPVIQPGTRLTCLDEHLKADHFRADRETLRTLLEKSWAEGLEPKTVRDDLLVMGHASRNVYCFAQPGKPGLGFAHNALRPNTPPCRLQLGEDLIALITWRGPPVEIRQHGVSALRWDQTEPLLVIENQTVPLRDVRLERTSVRFQGPSLKLGALSPLPLQLICPFAQTQNAQP
jgi:hypothetical protein